ncbi:hypothetical protein LZ32DRAFT_396202 [Colletotrichum eremochloae]|nr:hypothetical protein LZ32DRAFT_396202 [Colletotrichum eremochloae]
MGRKKREKKDSITIIVEQDRWRLLGTTLFVPCGLHHPGPYRRRPRGSSVCYRAFVRPQILFPVCCQFRKSGRTLLALHAAFTAALPRIGCCKTTN